MTQTPSSRLPWQAILEASRRKETPWTDVSYSILSSIERINLDGKDLGTPHSLPQETVEKISHLLDVELQHVSAMPYYLKISMRFTIFQSLVGVLIRQILEMDRRQEEGKEALMQLTQAIMLYSVRQIPFTVDLWRNMTPQLILEARPVYEEIIRRMEESIRAITGNSVYDFFTGSCTRHEVDKLLEKAHEAIIAEDKLRQFSANHNEGHTKLILSFVKQWQDDYQLRKMDTISPFLRCLEALWRPIKLGCRQGAERAYKSRCL